MRIIAALSLSAFFICLLATPMLRNLAIRLRLFVDKPDAHRKLHKKETPRIGGIAIVLSYVCALGLF